MVLQKRECDDPKWGRCGQLLDAMSLLQDRAEEMSKVVKSEASHEATQPGASIFAPEGLNHVRQIHKDIRSILGCVNDAQAYQNCVNVDSFNHLKNQLVELTDQLHVVVHVFVAARQIRTFR